MKPPVANGFRFGVYEADVKTGELRKQGVRIKLQGQPFEVLAALLERPGELVTRENLRERLWPADTFVDFDHGLNAAIARLRDALCDTAANPRYIETIPRRGYRFLVSVETLGGESVSERRVMLAVLPFENLDSNPEQEYFADGMTEEMIAQLGRLSPARLGVIARTSAMQYKRTTKGIDQIGPELGVDFVLEGSVRRAGARVRITAQLIRVCDQTHLWSESYDRMMEDVLAIQAECASRIARSMTLELLPGQQEALDAMHRAATRDPAAYESYLQGRYHWNKRTEDDFRKAIAYFERAVTLDPEYALAYVGLSDTFDILAMFSMMPPAEAFGKAHEAAKKALAIDGKLAEAHTSLAHARFLYEWDWPGAEEEFRLGLRLNPNHVQGHYWYALYLAAMRRFEEAFPHMQQALALDPVSLVVHTYFAWVCYFSRQYDQAIERFQKALDLDPTFSVASILLGLAYLQKGMSAEAIGTLSRGMEASGLHPGAVLALAAAKGVAGQSADAGEALDQVRQTSRARYVSPYYLALASLGLGNQEAALDWLERAFEERSGWLVYMNVEPAMDRIRAHPRFQDLQRHMALPA